MGKKINNTTTPKVVYTETAAISCFGKEAVEQAKAGKNSNLHKAKAEKNDEFYTMLGDIEAEMKHYRKHFKNKVVLCNCDDPESSNFFRFFGMNFDFLGLKKLVSTHYEPDGKSYALVVDRNLDVNGDGKINIQDTVKVELEGHGDFRSEECIKFLKEADIVVSNPPFSLFREYVDLLMQYKKKFIILGNMNAVTYKNIFSLFKANRMWYGYSIHSGDREFRVPDSYPLNASGTRVDEHGNKYIRVKGVRWFTNLPHKKRNQQLDLVGNTYSPEKYPKYDNYDAIEVSKTGLIPDGYKGVMGVPITFLDKYCPTQFKIVKFRKGNDDKDLRVNGKCPYFRILIKLKPAKKAKAKK
jgi:hypothetical protein